PPAPTISSTTASAGPDDPPLPSTSPPRSLTTTRAPWAASAMACARPSPRPAPGTTATRPAQSSVMLPQQGGEQLSGARDRDLREHAVGVRGDFWAGQHRGRSEDAPAPSREVLGDDTQGRVQRRGPAVAHLQLDGHARVAAWKV